MPTALRPRSLRLLAGGDLEAYCSTAARLILAGRLNHWFPDPYGCAEYLRCLSASVREGVCDGAHLDLTTGLPTLKDLVTVQADREIAADFVAQNEERKAAGRKSTPKVDAKLAYYRRILSVELPPLARLAVRLRRVIKARSAASFEVVFDKIDPAEMLFVRYTLLLEQEDRVWGSAFLERSGDYSRQTAAFREKMEKFAQDDSEIAFLLLGKVEGVRIEEVTRGRIGPLWSPWAPAPAGWGVSPSGREFILHLPLDRASVDVGDDRDNDPFEDIYRDFLSAFTRPLVDEEALRLGYRVHKDRKFVATPGAAEALASKLREAGTQNMVYVL
ncbi:MAG: hypothetical protein HY922_16785 [Elusimicrobia bacterium]|nr:hypothetical protein [Elusimicrobiota bacterium]